MAAGPLFSTCVVIKKLRRHLRTCSCLFTAVSNSVAAESERHFSGIVIGKRIRFSCFVTQGCAPEAETNDVSLPTSSAHKESRALLCTGSNKCTWKIHQTNGTWMNIYSQEIWNVNRRLTRVEQMFKLKPKKEQRWKKRHMSNMIHIFLNTLELIIIGNFLLWLTDIKIGNDKQLRNFSSISCIRI